VATLEHKSSASQPNSTARQLVGRSKCAVCRHPERWRIELLKAGGVSLNSLTQKFGVGRDRIDRHWHRHVSPENKATYLCGPAELAGLAGKAAQEGESVLDHLRMCRVVLTSQLSAASEAGEGRAIHRRELDAWQACRAWPCGQPWWRCRSRSGPNGGRPARRP
jgi:hypothetical protein